MPLPLGMSINEILIMNASTDFERGRLRGLDMSSYTLSRAQIEWLERCEGFSNPKYTPYDPYRHGVIVGYAEGLNSKKGVIE